MFMDSPIQIVDTHAKDTRIAEAGESGGHELGPIKEDGDSDWQDYSDDATIIQSPSTTAATTTDTHSEPTVTATASPAYPHAFCRCCCFCSSLDNNHSYLFIFCCCCCDCAKRVLCPVWLMWWTCSPSVATSSLRPPHRCRRRHLCQLTVDYLRPRRRPFRHYGGCGWLWFYAATHCLILVVAVVAQWWVRGMPLLIGGGVFSTISNCYWCRTDDPNDAQSDAIVGMPMMMSVEIDPGQTAMSNTVQMTRVRWWCCCCFSHYDWPIMLVLVK